MSALPVEGWVQRCASYGVKIVRVVVSGIRDRGPLDRFQVCALIKDAGMGADVAKASPMFDYDDGARRVLEFLLQDLEVIRVYDGNLTVDPDVRQAFSTALSQFIDIPSADEITKIQAYSVRFQNLRRWIGTQPFRSVWKDGLRKHNDAAVATMIEQIELVGYYGPKIVVDQHGVIIDGHLRAAALDKLGRKVADYCEEIFFPDDTYRLAWILNAHFHDGTWSPSVKKEVIRYVNHCMARSGVKMGWPSDIPLITGHFDEVPVLSVAPRPEPVAPREVATRRVRPSTFGLTISPAGGITKTGQLMLLLLERRSVPKAVAQQIIDNDGSCSFRGIAKGFIVAVDDRYEITEAGEQQALKIFKKFRPERERPVSR